MKIKMALTGNGNASKEQVAGMLQRLLKIPQDEMSRFMDATDALAAAYCHYLQMGRPESDGPHYRGWKDFVNKNKEKLWTPQKTPTSPTKPQVSSPKTQIKDESSSSTD
jgi:crossover junction endodeoxyribonuclease RuvC